MCDLPAGTRLEIAQSRIGTAFQRQLYMLYHTNCTQAQSITCGCHRAADMETRIAFSDYLALSERGCGGWIWADALRHRSKFRFFTGDKLV